VCSECDRLDIELRDEKLTALDRDTSAYRGIIVRRAYCKVKHRIEEDYDTGMAKRLGIVKKSIQNVKSGQPMSFHLFYVWMARFEELLAEHESKRV
jgi:hypothetical protein